MAGKIFVARQSTFLTLDGESISITAGQTRVREEHPLYLARPDLFKELDVHYDVETARQAPKAESKPAPEKAAPKSEAKAETAEGKGEASPAAAADDKPKPRTQRGPRKATGAGG